jgi:hypothetical protein
MMSQEAKSEQVIVVTVKVIDGDEDDFHFNVDHLIGKSKEQVMHRFQIKPPTGVIYHFAYEPGKILDENKTWRQEGVADHSTLLFGTEQQVG